MTNVVVQRRSPTPASGSGASKSAAASTRYTLYARTVVVEKKRILFFSPNFLYKSIQYVSHIFPNIALVLLIDNLPKR